MKTINKITIITATYNSSRTIADCIQSVQEQDYPHIEHIIIDGASTDNTLEIIKSMPNRVAKIVSEPDKGIYDAMNKGVALASGDIVGLLNSDDFYVNKQAISRVMELYNQQDVDCVFGDLNYVNQLHPERIVRKWHTGAFKSGAFRMGWHPAHPSFFVRNTVYQQFGVFTDQLKLAADFEIMLRFLEKNKISNYYTEEPLVNMRLGGATSGSFSNIIKQNIECYRAFKMNGIKVSVLYPLFRILPKLLQFFR